jgi:hypothetical protein
VRLKERGCEQEVQEMTELYVTRLAPFAQEYVEGKPLIFVVTIADLEQIQVLERIEIAALLYYSAMEESAKRDSI